MAVAYAQVDEPLRANLTARLAFVGQLFAPADSRGAERLW
jgi:hypothetical protein